MDGGHLPPDAPHDCFYHAKQLLGMVFFMDAASVRANKRCIYAPPFAHGWRHSPLRIRRDRANAMANKFAAIRPYEGWCRSPMIIFMV